MPNEPFVKRAGGSRAMYPVNREKLLLARDVERQKSDAEQQRALAQWADEHPKSSGNPTSSGDNTLVIFGAVMVMAALVMGWV